MIPFPSFWSSLWYLMFEVNWRYFFAHATEIWPLRIASALSVGWRVLSVFQDFPTVQGPDHSLYGILFWYLGTQISLFILFYFFFGQHRIKDQKGYKLFHNLQFTIPFFLQHGIGNLYFFSIGIIADLLMGYILLFVCSCF